MNLGKFTNCKFAYGRSFDYDLDYAGFDYVTIWMDTPAENCKGPSCTDWNQYYQGEMLNQCKKYNKTPLFYAYVIPFEARNAWGLKDCNMGYPNICQQGAKYVRENRARIIERYNHHSSKFDRPFFIVDLLLFFELKKLFFRGHCRCYGQRCFCCVQCRARFPSVYRSYSRRWSNERSRFEKAI